jgi:WD40 repeat protein
MRRLALVAIASCGLLLLVPTSRTTAAPAARPRLVVQLGHDSMVSSVAISRDGRLVLSGSIDHTARLWDAATGAELRRFEGHTLDVTSAAFSPDGRFVLTGSADTTVRQWDAATGEQVRRFANLGPVTSVAYSPDGRFAVAGSFDHSVRRFDMASGDELEPYVGAPDRVSSVAYSPDGRFVVAGCADGTAHVWNAATGAELRVLSGHKDWVWAVAVSPDSRFVLTGGEDKTARLWDATTGAEVRRFSGHARRINSVAFSPDGRMVLTGAGDGARAWDAQTGVAAGPFEGLQYVGGIVPSADGRFVLTGGSDGRLYLWDAATRKALRAFEGYAVGVRSVAFSPDASVFATGTDEGAHLWSTETGAEVGALADLTTRVTSLEFLPDGRAVLATAIDNSVGIYDAASGVAVRKFAGGPATLSADGRYLLTGSSDQEDRAAHLFEAATGKEVRRFTGHTDIVSVVAFSPDGRVVLTGSYDKTVRLWSAATGAETRRLAGNEAPLYSAVFSPDGRLVLTSGFDNTVRLWNATTGAEVRRLGAGARPADSVSSAFNSAAAFSPDGRYALVAGGDKIARLFDVATGAEAGRFEGHSSAISSVAFSPDGRLLVTGSFDSTTRVWDRATGKELCQLVSFRDGTWVAVDPDGRFDTNNLDEIPGLHWVVPDDPFSALPVEIFLRDYYEPRLLGRILARERFAPVRPVASLNRAQPRVRIAEVKVDKDAPERATVRVEVAAVRRSGAYDLRLFRDGQLVGSAPRHDEAAAGDDLAAWRRANAIALDPATGSAVVTFENVQLGRGAEERVVEFSAYAFNEDRIKSETAYEARRLKPAAVPAKGRAYLVVIGVNAYETPRFNLQYAANDAREIESALATRLGPAGEFEEIVPVELISDYETKGGQTAVTSALATKANIKAVLDLLAGKAVDPTVAAKIPNADRLRRASPRDFVLISFSGHGYADQRGRFFLVPYDMGEAPAGQPTDAFFGRLVSSDELGLWLRDVDAGKMAVIVDACHSAAVVQAEGFKPGPMGSRGLGQLAYDKGMWVLAATQADNIALESKLVRQGLLTYALAREGIEAGRADFRPKDAKILLSEWLAYGAERVPSLFEDVSMGRAPAVGAERPKLVGAGARALTLGAAGPQRAGEAQRPALFDFSRKRRDVALVK